MFTTKNLINRLEQINALVGAKTFTTSFGLEDQILTHFISAVRANITLVTLDTGRLFPETYDLWANTESRYKLKVKAFSPSQTALQYYTQTYGVNGFYDSLEARKKCCFARKMLPLDEALKGADFWLTGLRSSQSNNRAEMQFIEQERGLNKINPLLDFTRDELVEIAKLEGIPVNGLHEKGFLSIGCAPCTRAIKAGEDERAGRWWWENDSQECGLHIKNEIGLHVKDLK